MKLQKQTFLIIGSSMAVFLVCLIIFIRPMLLEDALEMDEMSTARDLDRVESYIKMEQDTLHRINLDWAQWDDTYEFIEGTNTLYPESNLTDQTFDNNDLNRMVFLDLNDEVVYDQTYETQVNSKGNDEAIFALIEQSEAYLILTDSVYSLVSVRNVLPTSGQGTGKLIMFRELNEEIIARIGKELSTQITVAASNRISNDQIRRFSLLDQETIRGYSYLNESLGNTQLTVAVEKDRSFYIRETDVITSLFYFLIGALLLFTIILYVIFNRLIVSRIGAISGQLKKIQQSKDVSLRVNWPIHNNDEIHELGNSVNELLGSMEDSQHEMVNMAYCDQLTGLLNRYGIYESFRKMIRKKDEQIAFLFFDLDGFKRINDSLGHQVGDDLLVKVTKRMQSLVNADEEMLARMGGDEFIMLIPYRKHLELRERIDQMLIILKKEYSIFNMKTFVTTSVGVSIYPADGSTFDEVLQHADIAMYEAKRKGKNQFVFYDDLAGDTDYKNILNLENDLKYALKQNELYLDYQPVYSPDGKELIGAEGLLRWNHPTRGLIPPNVFIPIAEDGNFICDIGEWVLEQGIRQVVEWRDAGLGSIGIAVNVSKQQMKQKERFLWKLDRWLKEYNLDPVQLQIEITESDIFYFDNEIFDFARTLLDKGVRVALDDFGVGTSTLFNLKQLPVNVVKIDRSFVNNVPNEPFDSQLLSGIYRVLEDLDFDVITEGVETDEQVQFVQSNSHSKMQGYYYSRPLKPGQVAILLQQQISRLQAASDYRKE